MAFEQRARTGLFATIFTFGSELNVHPTSRMAASGRNAHLRWRSDAGDQTLAFSRPEEGELSVVYEKQRDIRHER